ncbi:DUF4012 domain-containing protein, partial [Candidatus Woesebacteria bacterium]|nr:DUF4012 domain-containing protein [Candidatus Woesebacteria bacterium]
MFETVLIYSKDNLLVDYLTDILLINNLHIDIVGKNSTWKEKYLTNSQISFIDNLKTTNPNYVLIDSSYFEDADNKVERAIKIAKTHKVKTIYIEDLRNYKNTQEERNIPDYLGIVIVGDLFGSRSFPKNSVVLKLLDKNAKEFITRNEIDNVYPIFAKIAAKYIFKWLISFGPFGKVTFLSSGAIDTKSLVNYLENNKNAVSITDITEEKVVRRFGNKEVVKEKYFKKFKTLLLSLSRKYNNELAATARLQTPVVQKKRLLPRVGTASSHWQKTLPIFLLAFSFLLILPYLLVLLSLSNILILGSIYKKVGWNMYETLSQISQKISQVSTAVSKNYYQIPIGGALYKDSLYLNEVSAGVTNINLKGYKLAEDLATLVGNTTNDKKYNLPGYSDNLTTEIDDLFNEISFLQVRLSSASSFSSIFTKDILDIYDITKIKGLLLHARVISNNLPDLLGYKKQKRYLVLFQNNNVLRPTGGTIEYYGLATFNKGKLNSFTLSSTQKADNQLKGVVTPPLPISLYLGEDNWYLKNSNWEPDLSTSAQKAEWFLNKEENLSVDGVVAIDYETIKNILNYVGPIKYNNKLVDAKNVSEILSAESQSQPNTSGANKPLLISSLFDQIGPKIKNNNLDYPNITQIINRSFEEKHSQVFLHNNDAQSTFSEMGFTGNTQLISCKGNCTNDVFGVVFADANSFSNSNIKRDYRV